MSTSKDNQNQGRKQTKIYWYTDHLQASRHIFTNNLEFQIQSTEQQFTTSGRETAL